MDADVELEDSQATEPRDCGAVSKVTKGDFYVWPFIEAGSPPFIYLCPYC